MRGEGIKTVHAGEGGQKNGNNSVHVVVELSISLVRFLGNFFEVTIVSPFYELIFRNKVVKYSRRILFWKIWHYCDLLRKT
jgi:hypothetical protein